MKVNEISEKKTEKQLEMSCHLYMLFIIFINDILSSLNVNTLTENDLNT